ncbi:MAG: hypothetical protein ACKV22_41355 [Bryobacteraceae bacterium]
MKTILHTLAALLILLPTHGGISAAEDGLNIVVHEGRGAVNVLASNRAASPVVGVTDKSGKPVKGARVTFVLPPALARAVFADGRESISVATGADGRAAAADMSPIDLGSFAIVIRAEYRGLTAATTITQTNVATAVDVPSAGSGLVAGKETASFRILVLEGDDGVNIIDKKTAVRPVVRIVDKNNLPVAGIPVAVIILAKRGGPHVELPEGKNSTTVLTDADGRADVATVRPEGKGAFQIEVRADMQGQPIRRAITQTNFPTELAALEAGRMPGSSKPEGAMTSDANAGDVDVRVVEDHNAVTGDGTTLQPAVQARGPNGLPVSGVQVAFIVSSHRPQAVFPDGKNYMIATTDSNGRAEAARLRRVGNGTFEMKVLAAHRGRLVASTKIQQQKVAKRAGGTKSKSATGMSSFTKTLIAVGMVAAAGAGIASSRGTGGGGSTSTAGGVPIRIGAGSPTIGPPR